MHVTAVFVLKCASIILKRKKHSVVLNNSHFCLAFLFVQQTLTCSQGKDHNPDYYTIKDVCYVFL